MNLPKPITPTERQAFVPFSDSTVWQDLRTFYKDEGIDAWHGKVPFFASSNAFLAEACFQIIRTFWMEAVQQIGDASDKPFVLVELGAGHGNFSFYLLQRLCEWHETTAQSFKFVYVMSDLAQTNLEFWKNNQIFTPYLEKNVLDFAVWDVESGDKLETERQSIQLGGDTQTSGPVAIIANYLLDSLRCEYIRLEKGNLFRGWMPKNPDEQMAIQTDNFLLPSMQFFPLEQDEIADTCGLLEQLKSSYSQSEADNEFLFPVSALALLNQLHISSDIGTLFLVNDKGSGRPYSIFPAQKPALAMHHTLSIDVPFDILCQWTQAQGGYAVVTPSNQAVQNAGFLFSGSTCRFPFTETALQSHFVLHPTGDIFTLFQLVRVQQESADLRTLLACLNTCQWDPIIFDELFPVLLVRLAEEDRRLGLVADTIDGIYRVANQYYPLAGGANTLANVGMVFQQLGQFKLAIHHYQRSREVYGDFSNTRFYIGVCLVALEAWEGAQTWFQSVIAESSDHFTAQGYLNHCVEQIQKRK